MSRLTNLISELRQLGYRIYSDRPGSADLGKELINLADEMEQEAGSEALLKKHPGSFNKAEEIIFGREPL